ncbi:DNA-binding protein [bacterium]|jgi:hypothetical protein|nr:DNA-binding protein [bacterium]
MNVKEADQLSANANGIKFMRVKEVERVYGLKRSFLYDLVKQNRISSIAMKGRNKIRGIRLFRPEELERIIAESTTPPKE